jgi:hypothetical protein
MGEGRFGRRQFLKGALVVGAAGATGIVPAAAAAERLVPAPSR